MATASHADLSRRVAQHIAGVRFDELSSKTVEATKRAILDGLGVMLAASGLSPDIAPFVALARGFRGGAEASLLGFDERASLPMAALANGAMAHALDFEDAFDAVPTHPNASLLPAVFALSEARGPITGREFIVAVAVGCDLVCRMALSLRQPMETGGWYPPPILGGFGACAAASRLLRLAPAGITDAFSLLMCQNSCPGEIKYSPDTVIRAVREAFPAQAAVMSALLAEQGVKGFEHPLEGRSGFFALFAAGRYDAADILHELGRRFWIEDLSFKKWPCCRGTHAYIECAQSLRRQHAFQVEDIAAITVAGDEVQRMLCEPAGQKRAPQTLIDAKFSLPFTVAVALMQDEVTLGSFTAATLHNPALLALASKVQFDTVSGSSGRFGQGAASGELSIQLLDGRVLRHHVTHALGDPTRPLATAMLRAKFVDCARHAAVALPRLAAESMADRILELENVHDVGAVLRDCQRDSGAPAQS